MSICRLVYLAESVGTIGGLLHLVRSWEIIVGRIILVGVVLESNAGVRDVALVLALPVYPMPNARVTRLLQFRYLLLELNSRQAEYQRATLTSRGGNSRAPRYAEGLRTPGYLKTVLIKAR